MIVKKISELENSISKKYSTLYELKDRVNIYQRQIDEIKEIKDIKDYISQSVLAELGKLIHNELNNKEILDKEINQLDKEIRSLKKDLNARTERLNGDYENFKNSLSSLMSSNGLVDRKFRDYKAISGSGTNLNKDLLAIYLIYMNLIAKNSDFKLPFAIDSFVKNEMDAISQREMFSAISSYFLPLQTQTFFSIIGENLNKINGDFCEIRVEFPLLRADRYEEISRDIIEYDS